MALEWSVRTCRAGCLLPLAGPLLLRLGAWPLPLQVAPLALLLLQVPSTAACPAAVAVPASISTTMPTASATASQGCSQLSPTIPAP